MSGVSVAMRRRDDVDIERDRELVERAQSGNSDAFGDLYLRYFDRLVRFCHRRLGNVAEAEDAAQEAFAKAWKALDRFDGERRFYPWLSVIAANVCTDIVRRRARSTPVDEPELDRASAPVDGGVEAIVERADVTMIDAALLRISPRHREVLRLREAYEWSYQKIAEYQGVEVSTIETLLFRARRALRREFMALAEAQGAAAAVFLVVARKVFGRVARVAHLGKSAHMAKVVKLTAPAGSAEAGAAAGGASAPVVAAAAAGGGAAAGAGGAALVAGIVATLAAAGALSALAVSSSHAPKHASAGAARPAASASSPRTAGAAGGAAAGGGRSAGSSSTGSTSSTGKAGHAGTGGSASGGHSLPGGGTAGVSSRLPTVKVASPSSSGVSGLLGGAVSGAASAAGTAVQGATGAVSGTVKTVTKVVDTTLQGLLGGPPVPTTTTPKPTTTTTTTTLPVPTLPTLP